MSQFFEDLSFANWIQSDRAFSVIKVILVLLFGLLLARLVSRRLKFKKLHAQHGMILRRLISIAILTVAILWSLRQMGLELGVLLGAAGIFTVAIGFASQTSASNLISGIFLMGEKPFQIGDLIKVKDTSGYVLAIDFMSVKIRTFDNLLVRIPNETMLKSEVTNLSRFPIRRIDLQIGVAYKEDLERVRDLLFEIADKNPYSLEDPKPVFLFKGYGNSALEFQFSVWTSQEVFYQLRTKLYMEIKNIFDENDIEIPFPHLSLYTGSATEPLPIQLVTEDTVDKTRD